METFLSELYHSKHPEQTLLLVSAFALLVIIAVFLVMVIAQLGGVYNKMQKAQGQPTWQEELGLWWNGQAGLTARDTEQKLLLEHNYDGIQELDNHLPPWWKNLFYLTIIFSIGYWYFYHYTQTWELQSAEFASELAQAQIDKASWEKTQANSVNETNVKALTSKESLEEGAQLFSTHCTACHAKDGGGGVGPNLTDGFWLHGNKINEVFKTIKEGVPGKGMTAWQSTLNPVQIQKVASYVLSLNGTHPAAPKAPQGIEVALSSK